MRDDGLWMMRPWRRYLLPGCDAVQHQTEIGTVELNRGGAAWNCQPGDGVRRRQFHDARRSVA